MRKAIRVSLLVLLLTYTAYAGEIPNNIVDLPAPIPTAQVTGDMPNGLTTDSAATAIAVELLQGLLSLA